MSKEVGARLARLANERKVSREAFEAGRRKAADLGRARAEANLAFLGGLLRKLVRDFNRSADDGLEVSLEADDLKLLLCQSYTLLTALAFEPDAVRLESPPRSGRVTSRRFLITTDVTGHMDLVEEGREGAQAGSADRFCEGVFMLALGLYP